MDIPGFGPNLNLSHVDPDLVFVLVSSRKANELFAYLASIPGASEDISCQRIQFAASALRGPSLRIFWPQQPDEQSWTLHLAEYARIEATRSRLCLPQMVADPFYFYSHTVPRDAPILNQLSSSSSRIPGATFTPPQANSNDVLRDALMLNQLSASSSRIPGATFTPLQANSNDVLRHSAILNQSSAPGSKITAMTFPPQQTNLNAVLRDAPVLNQLSVSSSRIHGATFTPTQASSNDVLRHSAMLKQSSAPGSRIPAMTSPPQQTDSNAVINFPVRHARTFNQTSAFNLGAPASANDPRYNFSVAPASALLPLCTPGSGQVAPHDLMQNTVPPQELEQRKYGTPAARVQHAHQPGPEKFTPQMLSQNREVLPSVNVEGMRPASEVYQLDPVILRLNLASVIASNGTDGFATVLIRNDNTAKFVSAAIYRIPGTAELARIFAAACREGIRIAESHQPTTIILESHLVPLLLNIQCPEIEELKALLKPPRYVVRHISEESNAAACCLANYAYTFEVPLWVFDEPPFMLLPYL